MNADSTGIADADEDLCPICIEPFPPRNFSQKSRGVLLCCGKKICFPFSVRFQGHYTSLEAKVTVSDLFSAEGHEAVKTLLNARCCPMCRAELPGTVDETFTLLKSRVEQHDDWGWAHLQLGQYYQDGIGCEVDENRAFLHISKAAEPGNAPDPEAQHNLGLCYFSGRGVDKSPDDAARCFEASAAQGYASSQYYLGEILLRYKGDAPRAVRLYRSATEQGLDTAQVMLAGCFQHGTGISPSVEKALYWNRKAAEQGNVNGMATLAMMLMGIVGCKYEGLRGIYRAVGECVLPEALYWGRKALAVELGEKTSLVLRSRMAKIVEDVETYIAACCGNCGHSGSSMPSKCSRCKATFYCSKACQRNHWRKGHRWDCCDTDVVKLVKSGAQS